MMLQTWIGLLGCGLFVSAAVLYAIAARRRPPLVRCAVLSAVVAALLLPINGHAGIIYLRALSGDFSITSMVILTLALFTQLTGRDSIRASSASVVFTISLLTGLVLYPLELGLTDFTPYESGYGSNLLYTILLALALCAWWMGEYLVVYCIVLATAGFLLGVLESRNLLDYLLDTVIVFFAFFWLLIRFLLRRFGRAKEYPEVAFADQPATSLHCTVK
jgi:hypothetical protein